MIKRIYFVLIAFVALASGCNNRTKSTDATLRTFTFAPVKGIRYEEVKRRFGNGLSFNEDGFMQEPSWIIEVAAEDTMLAYSPQKKIMQRFYLQYDHGDVYNFAEEFFRVKHISKDSLVFQRIQVDGKVIAKDMRSDVNMTFYAQSYIKNKLKTTAAELQKPTTADTVFIKQRSAEVNADTSMAYAARVPVQFVPRSKIVTVEKLSTVDKLSKRTAAYDYMFPQYKITIDRAYRDFFYQCQAIVDYRGNIHILGVNGVLPEMAESRKKVAQAVADVYVKNLFQVVPGTTLGIAHNSKITLNLIGKAIKSP